MIDPRVLARIRNVPSRLFAALLTFGLMLGAPILLGVLSGVLGALDLDALAAVAGVLAGLVFVGTVVAAWVAIFQASRRIKRAEAALYRGDYDAATRDAGVVVRTVFRADYQMGALFTLALAAERLGAFPEAASLFSRALDMIPAMAAPRPKRRAGALLAGHAALDFAAMGDLARASQMLARCHRELGAAGQPGALEMLLIDDSALGALGVNSMLVELENRREPRPLTVLAWMLVTLKSGQPHEVLAAAASEGAALAYGLAPHERALAARVQMHAARAVGAPAVAPEPNAWAESILA